MPVRCVRGGERGGGEGEDRGVGGKGWMAAEMGDVGGGGGGRS